MSPRELWELGAVFLRLGATAFGGPAAHVAAIEREVVTKRGWLSSSQLLQFYGLTNLLPGPNSTELVVAIGRQRAGNWGGVVAGLGFILPAMALVWLLAIAYQKLQSFSSTQHIFGGMQPVVAAIVAQAALKLGKSVFKTRLAGTIAVGSAIACALGVNEVLWLLLMGGGLSLGRNLRRGALLPAWAPWPGMEVSLSPVAAVGLLFLKIGLVSYGGGYVLVAFLQRELVGQGLTQQQLFDAVAIGQITPGPLFTTATFVGYLLAGHGGAIGATVGIFLPGFVATLWLHGHLERWQNSPWWQDFLMGIEPAAWGLMAAVLVNLVGSLGSNIKYGVAALSLLVLIYRPQWSLLVLGVGAVVGVVWAL